VRIPGLRRKCRACGQTNKVDPAIDTCPSCGATFGPPVFGFDYDPDTPWQTDSDGVRIARFREWLRTPLKEERRLTDE
jgi:hypothetical protein